jgi:hemoglobin-like flavoprotein
VLSEEQKVAIVRSWRLVVPISETAAELFYKRLFELDPATRDLFPQDMSSQRRKLMQTLHFVVKALDWPDSAWAEDVDPQEDLFLVVLALGRRHRQLYRVQDQQYEVVGSALLWTLDQGLGEAFTPEVQAAWAKVYTLLATLMKCAKDDSEVEIASVHASTVLPPDPTEGMPPSRANGQDRG